MLVNWAYNLHDFKLSFDTLWLPMKKMMEENDARDACRLHFILTENGKVSMLISAYSRTFGKVYKVDKETHGKIKSIISSSCSGAKRFS